MSALDDFLFLLGDFDLVKDHGQLLKEAETELENLRKDAERGWYWAENLEVTLSKSDFDSFIADLKEHKELKEKK